MSRFAVPIACALAVAAASAATAGERLAGPVTATVVEVVDGDTLAVRARIWLGQELSVLVRLRGTARAGIVGTGPVTLTDIEADKYAGRVVADVATADGAPVAPAMMGSGLVRRHAGGRRAPWCDGALLADPAGGRL